MDPFKRIIELSKKGFSIEFLPSTAKGETTMIVERVIDGKTIFTKISNDLVEVTDAKIYNSSIVDLLDNCVKKIEQ